MHFALLTFACASTWSILFVLPSAADSEFNSASRLKRSDDQSPIEILVQSLSQQLSESNARIAASEARIATSEAKITASEARIAASEAKITASEARIAASDAKITALEAKMNKDQQTSVAFYAIFSSDPVTLGPKAPLIFNVANTNVGNGYDVLTGHFTAPVSGTYIFLMNFMGTFNSEVYVSMWVDNTYVIESVSHSVNTWDHVSGNLVVHLTAGQRVHLKNNGDVQKTIKGNQWSRFSGFLIQADP